MPLGLGSRNDEPVPDVVGKLIEAACLALSRAGHAVEPRRGLAQDIEPGTDMGAWMLVYFTVSGSFSEMELSLHTG